MDGLPLHPAIVHVPLGLSMVLPFVALAVTIAVWRKWLPARSWLIVLLLQAAMVVGALVSHQTGQQEEDLVGGIVDDGPVMAHEEAAEAFLQSISALFVVSALVAFFSRSRYVSLGHAGITLGSLGVLFLGMTAGHAGGRLIFVHGAAEAHLPSATGAKDPSDSGDDSGDPKD